MIRADVFRVSVQTGEESGWRRVDFEQKHGKLALYVRYRWARDAAFKEPNAQARWDHPETLPSSFRPTA